MEARGEQVGGMTKLHRRPAPAAWLRGRHRRAEQCTKKSEARGLLGPAQAGVGAVQLQK